MAAQLWTFDNYQDLFSLELFSEAGRRARDSAVHLEFSKIIDQWFLALQRRFGEREKNWKFRVRDHMHTPKITDTVWNVFVENIIYEFLTGECVSDVRWAGRQKSIQIDRLFRYPNNVLICIDYVPSLYMHNWDALVCLNFINFPSWECRIKSF